MRILVLFAHPLETSFGAAVHKRALATLRSRGHDVDDLDLYAERFDPVMSRQAFISYLDASANRAEVAPYVDRVLAAEALVLIFPVWCDGLPAILKGFFERVFLPGVSFRIDESGAFRPMLQNIVRMAAVATYGARRSRVSLIGDAPRRFVEGNLGALIAPTARRNYLAFYGIDSSTAQRRAQFLDLVARSFEAW